MPPTEYHIKAKTKTVRKRTSGRLVRLYFADEQDAQGIKVAQIERRLAGMGVRRQYFMMRDKRPGRCKLAAVAADYETSDRRAWRSNAVVKGSMFSRGEIAIAAP